MENLPFDNPTKSVVTTPSKNELREVYSVVGKNLPSFQPLEQFFVREYFPQPTTEDIDNEYLIRYFTRPANQHAGEIYEISKQTFDRIKTNNLYKSISMKWRVSGKLDDVMASPDINTPVRLYTGVLTANKLSLDMAESEMSGMKQKITNYAQFYKGTG